MITPSQFDSAWFLEGFANFVAIVENGIPPVPWDVDAAHGDEIGTGWQHHIQHGPDEGEQYQT
jgi:hypothetical protein